MIDFDQTPFTTIWEVTRACDLLCVHCRAEAQPNRHPGELTTAEGKGLLEQIHSLGSPVFVITGGDPLKRPDLFELIEYAVGLGLRVAVTPSGTPRLTPEAVVELKRCGVLRMALSVDGSTREIHDAFRKVPGSFDLTVRALEAARSCGLGVQINTTVTRHNLHDLPAIAKRAQEWGAAMWSVFFLVEVGRGRELAQLDAEEFESVFEFLYEHSLGAPYAVRTTAAPQYRRYVLQHRAATRRAGLPVRPVAGLNEDMPRAKRGVTDGYGLCFVSHTGEVYPSGFLPISAGSVREQPLARLYREAPLFKLLRDHDRLGGKCGRCEFRKVCGGSRARAYAATGDFMAEEPCCVYEPGQRRAATTASLEDPGPASA